VPRTIWPVLVRLGLIGVLALTSCREPPAVPVTISLANLAFGAMDDVPGPLPVTQIGTVRMLLQTESKTIDVWLRLPAAAVLRFRTEPAASPDAFRLSARIAGAERELDVTRPDAAAEWQAPIAGPEGAVVRLRLERRRPAFVAWRDARVVGIAHEVPAPLDTKVLPPADMHPNVIVYLVDALRADHLSVYGYPRDTTPNVADLAHHGVVFRRAYAAGPNTLISTPALFTSRHPSGVGSKFQETSVAEETIAEAFHAAGYRTAAFVANTAMLGTLGFARGFDEYVLNPPFPHTDEGERAPTDAVQRAALEWIARDPAKPFFVYIHTIDVHDRNTPAAFRGHFTGDGKHVAPATPPRQKDRVALADFLASTLEAQGINLPDVYDDSIAWTDHEIGELAHALDEQGVAARTAILILADHGEALGAEDDGTHGHSHSLYEELAHIPLVLVLPWTTRQRDVDEIVSHVDVAPTLTALAGIAGSPAWMGRNLFAPSRTTAPPTALMERLEPAWGPKAVVRPGLYGVLEWGVRTGPWKLLFEEKRTRLFDLPADPKETTDVSAAHPDETGELLSMAWRRSPSLAAGRIEAGRSPMDLDPERLRELLDALRNLGYVE
jgi:arylsulfatase